MILLPCFRTGCGFGIYFPDTFRILFQSFEVGVFAVKLEIYCLHEVCFACRNVRTFIASRLGYVLMVVGFGFLVMVLRADWNFNLSVLNSWFHQGRHCKFWGSNNTSLMYKSWGSNKTKSIGFFIWECRNNRRQCAAPRVKDIINSLIWHWGT